MLNVIYFESLYGILMRILLFFNILLISTLALANDAPLPSLSLEASLAQFPIRTTLSQKALNLKQGMTRDAVYRLLGPPKWAVSSKGLPLV